MPTATNEFTTEVARALGAVAYRLGNEVREAAAALHALGDDVKARGESCLRRSGDAIRLALSGDLPADEAKVAVEREEAALEALEGALVEAASVQALKRVRAAIRIAKEAVFPLIEAAATLYGGPLGGAVVKAAAEGLA